LLKFLRSLFGATQASLGGNSPVISGVGGNVSATYNFSPEIPEKLADYLLEQIRKIEGSLDQQHRAEFELNEKNKLLEELARKYQELEKRLAEEAPKNTLA